MPCTSVKNIFRAVGIVRCVAKLLFSILFVEEENLLMKLLDFCCICLVFSRLKADSPSISLNRFGCHLSL